MLQRFVFSFAMDNYINDLKKEIKIFVIHVKGNEERAKQINLELKRKNLEAEFILEGNKDEMPEVLLHQYFTPEMQKPEAKTSCALKHLLAYDKMVKNKIDLALIVEDDISFYSNFSTVFPKSIVEIEDNKLTNILVSYEDSTLRYVKNSKLKKGQLLYPQTRGRTTGIYLIDINAATSILENAQKNKISLPIDWYHNKCAEKGIITIYWCQPTIACQGSFNGKLGSLIDKHAVWRSGIFRWISFSIQRVYKRALFKFR